MKQTKKTKLDLSTQTVRSLTTLVDNQLNGVAGGSLQTKIITRCGASGGCTG